MRVYDSREPARRDDGLRAAGWWLPLGVEPGAYGFIDEFVGKHSSGTVAHSAVTSQATYLRRTTTGWLVQAPAKLNLRLEVLARRADDFHELQTLITRIGLFDTLHLSPRLGDSSINLRVRSACSPGLEAFSADVPTDERNLVVRALKALQAKLGVESGVDSTLIKRIPSQAGLGGGSSDAAAALIAGQELWGVRLAAEELSALAAELGSDVPFFLQDSAAVCRGRGERVEPVRLPSGVPCVLVQPPVGLGAGQVFGELRPEELRPEELVAGEPKGIERLQSALVRGHLREAGRWMVNSLQGAAARLTDWIGRLAAAFNRLPVAAHQMSGSGSVYYGLCENWRLARSVAARLRQQRLGWVGLAATC